MWAPTVVFVAHTEVFCVACILVSAAAIVLDPE